MLSSAKNLQDYVNKIDDAKCGDLTVDLINLYGGKAPPADDVISAVQTAISDRKFNIAHLILDRSDLFAKIPLESLVGLVEKACTASSLTTVKKILEEKQRGLCYSRPLISRVPNSGEVEIFEPWNLNGATSGRFGKSALVLAARAGAVDIVTYLLAFGRGNIIVSSSDGYCAFTEALTYYSANKAKGVEQKWRQVLTCLMDKISVHNSWLKALQQTWHEEIAEELIEKSSGILKRSNSFGPLVDMKTVVDFAFFAAERGKKSIFSQLLDNKFWVENIGSYDARLLVELACVHFDLAMVEKVLKVFPRLSYFPVTPALNSIDERNLNGSSSFKRLNSNYNALTHAVAAGKPEVVKFLLELGGGNVLEGWRERDEKGNSLGSQSALKLALKNSKESHDALYPRYRDIFNAILNANIQFSADSLVCCQDFKSQPPANLLLSKGNWTLDDVEQVLNNKKSWRLDENQQMLVEYGNFLRILTAYQFVVRDPSQAFLVVNTLLDSALQEYKKEYVQKNLVAMSGFDSKLIDEKKLEHPGLKSIRLLQIFAHEVHEAKSLLNLTEAGKDDLCQLIRKMKAAKPDNQYENDFDEIANFFKRHENNFDSKKAVQLAAQGDEVASLFLGMFYLDKENENKAAEHFGKASLFFTWVYSKISGKLSNLILNFAKRPVTHDILVMASVLMQLIPKKHEEYFAFNKLENLPSFPLQMGAENNLDHSLQSVRRLQILAREFSDSKSLLKLNLEGKKQLRSLLANENSGDLRSKLIDFISKSKFDYKSAERLCKQDDDVASLFLGLYYSSRGYHLQAKARSYFQAAPLYFSWIFLEPGEAARELESYQRKMHFASQKDAKRHNSTANIYPALPVVSFAQNALAADVNSTLVHDLRAEPNKKVIPPLASAPPLVSPIVEAADREAKLLQENQEIRPVASISKFAPPASVPSLNTTLLAPPRDLAIVGMMLPVAPLASAPPLSPKSSQARMSAYLNSPANVPAAPVAHILASQAIDSNTLPGFFAASSGLQKVPSNGDQDHSAPPGGVKVEEVEGDSDSKNMAAAPSVVFPIEGESTKAALPLTAAVEDHKEGCSSSIVVDQPRLFAPSAPIQQKVSCAQQIQIAKSMLESTNLPWENNEAARNQLKELAVSLLKNLLPSEEFSKMMQELSQNSADVEIEGAVMVQIKL